VEVVTARVSTTNSAEVALSGMLTPPVTTAAGSELFKITSTPPAGAGASRVTVPTEGVPCTTVVGLSVTEVRLAATPEADRDKRSANELKKPCTLPREEEIEPRVSISGLL
jgi:hypothetical protein